MESEHDLVENARAGDAEAFAALVARHRSRIHAVVARMVGEAEAEEVVQEALLRAFLGLSRLRAADRFAGWLCAIAVNLAKMRLRRRAAHERAMALVGVDRLVVGDPDRELLAVVREAVALLPRAQRDVVLMHYVDELSCDEIAHLLGTSPGAVRTRLHRARRSLREELAPLAPTPKSQTRKDETMIEMAVADVLVRVGTDDASKPIADQRIVLLQEDGGDRILPIWIGPAEGNMLAARLTGYESPRPMSADVMIELVRVAGGRIDRVAITALRDDTFFASISVAIDGRTEQLDARPSDAMNLAVRSGAPIFVAEDVLSEAGHAGGELASELDNRTKLGGFELPPGSWASLSAEMLGALHVTGRKP